MFTICNLFPSSAGHSGKMQLPAHSMTFDTFKKYFYPHLYIVEEEPQSDEDREVVKKKQEFKNNKEKQGQVVEGRI